MKLSILLNGQKGPSGSEQYVRTGSHSLKGVRPEDLGKSWPGNLAGLYKASSRLSGLCWGRCGPVLGTSLRQHYLGGERLLVDRLDLGLSKLDGSVRVCL